MKFLAATIAYISIGVLFGWGILMAVHGKYWLLGAVVLAYVVAFSIFGCLPPRKTH